MEEGLKQFPDVVSFSPQALAWMGDSVYELMIRERLLKEGCRPAKELNRLGSTLANAGTQRVMADAIRPLLTEEEEAVFKRGRNANTGTMAKHASMQDYRRATGFEALIGYLHILGREDRIRELVFAGWEHI